jgi:tRNA1Val (adenine37-N6)-methyltransferase
MNGEFSDDTIFNGKVAVRQRCDGYRFSLDSLLLAWYAFAVPASRALELGAGSGVVSLALAYKRPDLEIIAVEIQESLFRLAVSNIEANKFGRVEAVRADLRRIGGPKWDGRFDLVLSNPPFREVGSGRLNPEPEKAQARHEILATLDDVISCAARTLRGDGAAALVLLPERERDLESATARWGLGVVHRCMVRPYEGREANILLALLKVGVEGKCAVSEFLIYRTLGEYTPEAKAIIEGEWEKVPHPLVELPSFRRNI